MELLPAETSSFASPIPTQFVSSDEFTPLPQTAKQKEVVALIKELGNRLAKHQGVSRRKFLPDPGRHGRGVRGHERRLRPDLRREPRRGPEPRYGERAREGASRPVHHGHAHPLPARRHLEGFVRQREAVGKAGWNPALAGKPQTLDDLKFANYRRSAAAPISVKNWSSFAAISPGRPSPTNGANVIAPARSCCN